MTPCTGPLKALTFNDGNLKLNHSIESYNMTSTSLDLNRKFSPSIPEHQSRHPSTSQNAIQNPPSSLLLPYPGDKDIGVSFRPRSTTKASVTSAESSA
ncbi:hypothetical protein WG66_003938 [Moniliophthora roreri]|nr:hypothetical protein WG66_003938 [Moniliophthora roreri]